MELQTGDGSVREDYVVSYDLELQTGDGSVREDYVVSHDLELQTGDGSVRTTLFRITWSCKQVMALLERTALFQVVCSVVFGL